MVKDFTFHIDSFTIQLIVVAAIVGVVVIIVTAMLTGNV